MADPLRVLFEDEHCLAIVKPPGQFVQGSWAPPGESTLEQVVRRHLDPHDPGSVYLGIVHRLDRPVSGVLIWAKTAKAARRLSSQFERRRAVKEYWAIVEVADVERVCSAAVSEPGTGQAQGRWTDWLTGPGVSGVARSVPPESPGARVATTRFCLAEAIRTPPGCRWLCLWPETGRTHQLRVQAASRGMPILGDAAYGSTRRFPQGIALHARALRVRHPILQTPLVLIADLPPAWAEEGINLPDRQPGQELA